MKPDMYGMVVWYGCNMARAVTPLIPPIRDKMSHVIISLFTHFIPLHTVYFLIILLMHRQWKRKTDRCVPASVFFFKELMSFQRKTSQSDQLQIKE